MSSVSDKYRGRRATAGVSWSRLVVALAVIPLLFGLAGRASAATRAWTGALTLYQVGTNPADMPLNAAASGIELVVSGEVNGPNETTLHLAGTGSGRVTLGHVLAAGTNATASPLP